MKANAFNICPTSIHRNTTSLTHDKSQVWSCSEYGEYQQEADDKPNAKTETKRQSQMAMA